MSSVLKRKMFMKPPVKKAAGGIMSLMGEEEGDDEDIEEAQDNFSDRVPENPEIIANNLRGDVRSLEERYYELAQMVGEQAFETPEEVLVLMQSQLAAMPQPGQQPAAPAPNAQGLMAIAQGAQQQGQPQQPGQPPAQGGAPAQPGGIESLVAGGPEQQPTQQQQPAPPTQAPVQRAMGSGPMGEMSTSMPITDMGEPMIPETMSNPVIDPVEQEAAGFSQSAGSDELLLRIAAGEVPEDLAERMLAPVQRNLGSGPMGERIEPTMRIADVINQGNTAINQQSTPAPRRIPAWQRSLMAEGILPDTPDNTPKSRPLTA